MKCYLAYDAYKGCFYPIKDWAAERVMKSKEPMINGNVENYKDLSKVVNLADGSVFLAIDVNSLEKKVDDEKK